MAQKEGEGEGEEKQAAAPRRKGKGTRPVSTLIRSHNISLRVIIFFCKTKPFSPIFFGDALGEIISPDASSIFF